MANAGGMGGGNAFQQSAGAMNAAQAGTIASGMGPNIAAFQNPFQRQVIDRTQADIERQRQMAMNTLGAQASAAGAFGGSRHGVAEAMTNEGFARQAGDIFANQRMQGFNTALGAAQNQQNIGLQAAGQLGGLAGQQFGQAMGVSDMQMRQGMMQQALNQQLIDAAKAQYAGFTGSPQAALQLPLQAVAAGNMGQGSQQTSQQPGLLNYLALGASLFSDRRLKANVRPAGERGGVAFYVWDWNDEGQRVAAGQPCHGVMADEVEHIPGVVVTGPDGYQRVNYGVLHRHIEACGA